MIKFIILSIIILSLFRHTNSINYLIDEFEQNVNWQSINTYGCNQCNGSHSIVLLGEESVMEFKTPSSSSCVGINHLLIGKDVPNTTPVIIVSFKFMPILTLNNNNNQVGAEVSIQKTYISKGIFLTKVFSILQVLNQYDDEVGKWKIWVSLDEEINGWVQLDQLIPNNNLPSLQFGIWNNISWRINTAANSYHSLTVNGININLEHLTIVTENKNFDRTGVRITLESENLSNCLNSSQSISYFDDLVISN